MRAAKNVCKEERLADDDEVEVDDGKPVLDINSELKAEIEEPIKQETETFEIEQKEEDFAEAIQNHQRNIEKRKRSGKVG